MPEGTCDPASRGMQWNEWTYAVDENQCWATVRWDWDGVSVRPNCDGPVIDIHVVNTSNVTYYANLPNKKRGNRNIEIPPGTDDTITGNRLRQLGLELYSDTNGPSISKTPFI